MPRQSPPPPERVPTSTVLERLLAEAPAERVTLAWLIGALRERSFGIVLFLIALIGFLPAASGVTGLLLLIPAYQMIVGRAAPKLPRWIAERPLPTPRLATLVRRVAPVLRWLERFIYPRWSTPFETTKRVIGGVVLLLAFTLLSPLPLSNIVPGLTIMLIAFAFLEKDGLLLAIAILIAVGSIAVTAASVWGTVLMADWL